MLAESWETSPDGLRWRVRLRPNLTFHSGAPCDAPALLETLRALRTGDSSTGEIWYWMPVDQVWAEGGQDLVFTLRHPYSRLPSLLWGTHTAVHNEGSRRSRGAGYGFGNADGTGPFRLSEWSAERVVATRWEGYAGCQAPHFSNHGGAHVEQIEWLSMPDEHERLEALLGGQVDCLHGPPLGEVERLRAEPALRVIEFPQASSIYLALDWGQGGLGFDEVRMRRAISLGIDRRALVAQCLAGEGSPTWGPIGPGDPFYDASVDLTGAHDPATAGRLLDELGWELRSDGLRARGDLRLSFECLAQDDQVQRRIAESVRTQLARLGVALELRFARPFAEYYAACDRRPQSLLGKWLWQDGLDAIIGFTGTWGQPAPNWQHSSCPSLDKAYLDWLRAGSREELQAAAARVQSVFASELPYIPLVRPNDIWVHSRRVRGWRPYAANLYPYYQDVEVEPG
jgi:ABC-type transport system substrate-binding protein